MTLDEWNDIRHIVINKLLDIEYHREHIKKLCMSFELEYERKCYHLNEIHKRIKEIENWFEIKRKELDISA